jgi:hypothetical protein
VGSAFSANRRAMFLMSFVVRPKSLFSTACKYSASASCLDVKTLQYAVHFRRKRV